MNKEDIHLYDWQRIFIGDVPPVFFVEVIIRIIVIYALLIISMRLMGKRMSSQLNVNELAALVSLAAAIGVPLQAPDRGLLPAFIIALVVILTERFISGLAFKNQSFEKISQGDLTILVENSRLCLKHMKKSRITRERLFAHLRSQGITNLGAVKRTYLETSGTFTILQNGENQPGLSLIPWWDTEFQARQKRAEDYVSCNNCGNTQKAPFNIRTTNCSVCKACDWTEAYIKE